MGAIAANLPAAEKLAWDHVHAKAHIVHVSGRGLLTQVVSLQAAEE